MNDDKLETIYVCGIPITIVPDKDMHPSQMKFIDQHTGETLVTVINIKCGVYHRIKFNLRQAYKKIFE